ncbi:MAG TPA: MMPL family transporter [Acidimicrobiales bacterium]|nr:MMPL family transporter [Acidimicrobiales bacterium]
MATFLYRLGHLSVRRRRYVLFAWIALLLLAAGASKAAGGETSDEISLPGTESQTAFDLLADRFPSAGGSFTQVVFAAEEGHAVDEPQAMAAIDRTMAAMGKVDGVSVALGPKLTGAISEDHTTALGMVRYPDSVLEVEDATTEAVAEAAGIARDAGIRVEFGGQVVPGVEMEPPSTEMLGLAVAIVVLLVSFGSVLAMGLPIVTALLGLGIGISGIGLLSAVVDLSSTAPTLAIMIGLAVGIDYALFVVTRHRQNLAAGLDVEEAAARANATAGGAVLFAGITVVIAIAGLAVIGIPFVTVMGLAAAATVAIAVLVAITLLPALLGFVGHNIDRFRVPGLRNRTGATHEGETWGTRWARTVTERPGTALAGGLVVMAVLALPVLSMRMGLPDAGSEPTDSTQRQAYDLVSEKFGAGYNAQLSIVVDLTGARASEARRAVATVEERLRSFEGVDKVLPPEVNEAGDTAVIQVVPASGPADPDTESLVHGMRGDVRDEVRDSTGSSYYVAGATAANIDISDKLADALVPFVALVIGLTLVLLTIVFRSILVPIKAALAILVSIGSSFGVLVAVFNWGWLAGLVGVDQTLPIVSFLPMMMFAILFGLSMDYEVFILTRIHEEYHRTRDAAGSVLTGISASARVITAAALIMISVFAAFTLGDSPIIKMFGVGLAAAVFLDATVVRMVLVPAVMTLFGDRAWRLPRWLDRILPDLDVEGEELVERLEAHDAEVARRRAAASREEPTPVG